MKDKRNPASNKVVGAMCDFRAIEQEWSVSDIVGYFISGNI
jgi:hypothetical protein